MIVLDNKFVNIKCGKISFNLKSYESFEWLDKLGEAFCVFDQQDSGNLCFGVKQENGKRIFVKYAGASTTEYNGNLKEAAERLKDAVSNYIILQHDKLIQLYSHFPTENGYAGIFEWFDGDCLFDHWNFDKYPRTTHPESTYVRFHKLAVETRLKCLDDIFRFHVHVEENNYQAVDFYDGSILYNFEKDEMKICDIDFYSKKPYINRFCWGSRRTNSPEDYIKGAILDASTNVYNLGAIAFCLIGCEMDRTIEKWEGSESQFFVAKKAINIEKSERFHSVADFYREWINASK